MAGTVLYDTMGVRSMTFTCDDCGTPVDAWDLDDYQDWTGEKFGCCPYCGSVELTERDWWEKPVNVDTE